MDYSRFPPVCAQCPRVATTEAVISIFATVIKPVISHGLVEYVVSAYRCSASARWKPSARSITVWSEIEVNVFLPASRRHAPAGGFLPVFAQNEIVFDFFGHFPPHIANRAFTIGLVSLSITLEKLRRKQGYPLLRVWCINKTEGRQEFEIMKRRQVDKKMVCGYTDGRKIEHISSPIFLSPVCSQAIFLSVFMSFPFRAFRVFRG